jgi:glycosyltransferase involved in cell wall biosynthesis
MRIALVSFEYPPFHGGGIGTYAGIMSRWLARAGHQVHVIANGWGEAFSGSDPGAEGIDELTVHRVRALDRSYEPQSPHDRLDDPLGTVARRWEKALYWSYLVAQELSAVCRRHHLEVVEFPECFAEAYTSMRWRAAAVDLTDLAMCVHLHTPIQDHTELNLGRTFEPWYRRRVMMEEYCIAHADRLCSPSRSLAGIVSRRLGLDPARHPCDVIPYALDFDRSTPGTAVRSAEPTLLFVGRLEPRKGVRYLIDAALRLMDDFPTLSVHFLGRDCPAGEAPGTMVEALRRRIPARHLPRFVFEGLRPREEVLQRYAAATACVFAAPWDNFPFTCFEAMASGACIVASDQGGMAEVIEHQKSGLIVRSRDVGALASAIRSVLTEPQMAERLRGNASRRVRQVCDPHAVVEQRLEHYQRAIDTSRRSPE